MTNPNTNTYEEKKVMDSQLSKNSKGHFEKRYEIHIQGLQLLQTLCHSHQHSFLCEVCGLDPTSSSAYLSRILAGEQKPSDKVKQKLSVFFNVPKKILFFEEKKQ